MRDVYDFTQGIRGKHHKHKELDMTPQTFTGILEEHDDHRVMIIPSGFPTVNIKVTETSDYTLIVEYNDSERGHYETTNQPNKSTEPPTP